ncbi:MAG: DUF4924 family protein [Bacteroidales bacterium]|jgi:hypothetical protein|nr:DUF4924 family protein [Bacteroidales bacterium]MBO7545442.1 DUF4924 family protein [Paludibacteraceae bacterium]MBQ7671783.1 DUF4924 family protein [Paludibacteraceae bacterium]
MISKKDNIAEYILQTWQMEDLVRAFQNDEALEQNAYLRDLKDMMRAEGVLERGHVQLAQIAVSEMDELHSRLYDEEATYRAAWLQLLPSINILKAKTDDPTQSDMQMCLTFLYEIMLLRLQKKPISPETTAVQESVSRLLSVLAATYKDLAENTELLDE